MKYFISLKVVRLLTVRNISVSASIWKYAGVLPHPKISPAMAIEKNLRLISLIFTSHAEF